MHIGTFSKAESGPVAAEGNGYSFLFYKIGSL